jgi:hypothetical protein
MDVTFMKTLKTLIGFALTATAMAASAHTVAMGSVNAGAPGAVTIWMGTYSHGTPSNLGSLTIGGSTVAFNLLTTGMPAGLVLGTNYFFAPYSGGAQGQYDQPTNTMSGTGAEPTQWQGVTVTGLSAGLQAYSITGMTTAQWADWSSGQSNWTGSVFIPGSSVNVPEPTTFALAGLALLGLGLSRRKAA